MSLAAGVTNFILWFVAGVVGLISEGIRRLHNRIKDLKDQNKEQAKEIDALRKHLGLEEEMNGRSRIDKLESDVDDIADTLERHEIYWTGDPDDPSHAGALGELHTIRNQLEDIRNQIPDDEDHEP